MTPLTCCRTFQERRTALYELVYLAEQRMLQARTQDEINAARREARAARAALVRG